MPSIRGALGLSFVERYAMMVLGLASYVLIARLLTPAEIGVYSVTAALVGITQMLRDFGVSTYLIQEVDLTNERRDSAFGFALIAGVIIFVAVFASAPLVSRFYDDQRVAEVLRVMCLNFVVLPACSVAISLLRRAMRFDLLLYAGIAGGVAGFVVTIALAILQQGPASLAWGAVATNTVTAVVAWVALGRTLRPGRPTLVAWRRVFDYGRQSTFAGVLGSAAIDANDLVVGKVLGLTPVALLSRAMGLMNMFQRDMMGAARNVAFPAFAAMHRDGKPLEPTFVYGTACITAMAWPFYGFLALFPLEAIRFLAGPQWDAAQPYVVVFAAAGAVVCIATLTQTLVLAMGRVDLASRADIINSLVRLGAVSVAALVFRDLMAVSIAFLVSFALSALIFFAFKQTALRSDWRALVTQAGRSLSVTVCTLAIPAIVSIRTGLGRTEPLPTPTFLLVCAVATAGWLLALRWCRHPMASDPIFLGLMARLRAPLAIKR